MLIEYDRYPVASHFVPALENGDYSGLSDEDEKALEAFLGTLPRGYQVWNWSDDEQFCRDEVTGLQASCLEGVLFVDSATV